MDYDTPAKKLYRSRREGAITSFCKKPVAVRRVAYLDTGAALDTLFRLEAGYRPENLYPINRNPAEAAHLTMTLKKRGLHGVRTCGLDMIDAMRRGRVPPVDVVDFDGMQNVSLGLLSGIRELVGMSPSVTLAVTAFGGRETATLDIMKALATRDGDDPTTTSFGTATRYSHLTRVRAVLTLSTIRDLYVRPKADACIAHATDVKWDVYVNHHGSPMVWFVAALSRHRAIGRGKNIGRRYGMSRRAIRLKLYPWCLTRELIAETNADAVTDPSHHRNFGCMMWMKQHGRPW